jgi:hypothetical protein
LPILESQASGEKIQSQEEDSQTHLSSWTFKPMRPDLSYLQREKSLLGGILLKRIPSALPGLKPEQNDDIVIPEVSLPKIKKEDDEIAVPVFYGNGRETPSSSEEAVSEPEVGEEMTKPPQIPIPEPDLQPDREPEPEPEPEPELQPAVEPVPQPEPLKEPTPDPVIDPVIESVKDDEPEPVEDPETVVWETPFDEPPAPVHEPKLPPKPVQRSARKGKKKGEVEAAPAAKKPRIFDWARFVILDRPPAAGRKQQMRSAGT